ncbi:MAG TPA: RNA polymerase sigma factor [Thermoanaerobaculia bacterium]
MSSDDTFLVLRAQSGDRAALEQLLGTIQEPLHRYVASLVGTRAAADDILQDVFVRIWRKLGWLHDPALFRPWAFRIASREAFRHLAREQKWREQVRDDEVLATLPAAPQKVDDGELTRLIAEASPASRAVLVLHYSEELTFDEISEVLGIAVGTVKSRLAYGLRTLRRVTEGGKP